MRNNVLLSAPLESDGEDGVDEMDEVDSDGAGDSSALALSQDYLGTTMDIQEQLDALWDDRSTRNTRVYRC